ncbi:mannosyltransferase putative-domain-containing protein [Cladochytrium replicatum]|nr:mannosyltransferase putative-domain-containing protein [Cladochytrium replicatum]
MCFMLYNLVSYDPLAPAYTFEDADPDYYWNLAGLNRTTLFRNEMAELGPCRPSNERYQLEPLPEDARTLWPVEDILRHRRDWQRWLETTYRKRYASLQRASMHLEQRQGIEGGIQGRGIVIYLATPEQIKFLAGNLALLRKYNCSLPVEVFAFSSEEVWKKPEHRQQVLALNTTEQRVDFRSVENRNDYVTVTRDHDDRGFHIKIAAILNSRFRELIALDVDAFPMRNPEFLFETPEFKENGAITWNDYWKTHKDNPAWLWMDQECTDEWEQESGIIVLDKARSWRALHLTWYLSATEKLRKWHKFLHGDKDIFRFAFRATQTPSHRVRHWLIPGGATFSGFFCGLAMVQPAPDGSLAFAHVNLVKYTKSPLDMLELRVYEPIEESRLKELREIGVGRWAETAGVKAHLFGLQVKGGSLICVGLQQGAITDEGLYRMPKTVQLADYHPTFTKDFWEVFGQFGAQ